jgi:hypothetical protein
MNGSRKQLLSCAGLTRDQHSRFRRPQNRDHSGSLKETFTRANQRMIPGVHGHPPLRLNRPRAAKNRITVQRLRRH